jgi:lyso-ornithine lipid O-acyltransferase
VGTIFIRRAAPRDVPRVERLMREALAGGRTVVLFAEGTSSDGSRVLPLKAALLERAAREAHPVGTATLAYFTHPLDPQAGRALCWWGEMTFLPHLWQVCRLQPSVARVTFGAPVAAPDRRTLASRLHRTLSHHLEVSGHAR